MAGLLPGAIAGRMPKAGRGQTTEFMDVSSRLAQERQFM
jgi:hypothetical protein